MVPATSKHREAGKQDVIQTFDPFRHHGANLARFLNYVNRCLANKFRTITRLASRAHRVVPSGCYRLRLEKASTVSEAVASGRRAFPQTDARQIVRRGIYRFCTQRKPEDSFRVRSDRGNENSRRGRSKTPDGQAALSCMRRVISNCMADSPR